MKLRHRDIFACATVCAVSLAWSWLVCVYCVGTSRRQRADRKALQELRDRFDSLRSSIENVANSFEDLKANIEDSRSSLIPVSSSDDTTIEKQPRFVARGKTRGARSLYIWEDWELEDGTMQRRYVLRLPLDFSS